ncbi:hypothetical protein HHI36_020162 [Cryptolaemus montrouzieri]|uniref:Fork-head domain-containing protein n=1 Tax=Cryptolaemus montrouzieri TaxID=559131 RepID=A0ABD2N9D0_9CUCU
MEAIEVQHDANHIEKDEEPPLTKNNELVDISNSSFLEDQMDNAKADPCPDLYEETSYHELRCLSNEDIIESNHILPIEYREYEELNNMRDQSALVHNYCKFHRTISENYNTAKSVENTDDQLFIEIIKEEIDSNPDPDEETSLFDSITFNIEDYEDSMIQIKIDAVENDYCVVDEPSDYVFFKKPQNSVPEITKVKKRTKERKKHRKPIGLANYRNLITDAINSSPEKRMILTDIYKWIIENVPFFEEKEDIEKDSWKNCIRHTLSVNKRFIRIKNRDNIRSSYWTVCEDGDFHTKFAAFPWAADFFRPEERKRKPKTNKVIVKRNNEKQPKQVSTKIVKKVIDKVDKTVKKTKTKTIQINGRKNETLKPGPKVRGRKKRSVITNDSNHIETNNTEKIKQKKQMRRSIRNVNESMKDVVNQTHQTRKTAKKKINLKILKKKKNTKTKKYQQIKAANKKKKANKKEVEMIRRSGRKKVARKSWKF